MRHPDTKLGFALIQLSIALVILGMIAGGILVGQDFIKSAEARAEIAQIEKYNTAANDFKSKYGYWPGDIPGQYASKFGFTVGSNCTGSRGSRDGNGLIEGDEMPKIFTQGSGETSLFWQDLSSAELLDVTIPNSGVTIGCGGCPEFSADQLNQIFPSAKAGTDNYVYVYNFPTVNVEISNWFGIYSFTRVGGVGSCGDAIGDPAISVMTAYNIDKKIDDAFPLSGKVRPLHIQGRAMILHSSWNRNDPLSCFTTNDEDYQHGAYSTTASAGNNSDSPNCAIGVQFH